MKKESGIQIHLTQASMEDWVGLCTQNPLPGPTGSTPDHRGTQQWKQRSHWCRAALCVHHCCSLPSQCKTLLSHWRSRLAIPPWRKVIRGISSQKWSTYVISTWWLILMYFLKSCEINYYYFFTFIMQFRDNCKFWGTQGAETRIHTCVIDYYTYDIWIINIAEISACLMNTKKWINLWCKINQNRKQNCLMECPWVCMSSTTVFFSHFVSRILWDNIRCVVKMYWISIKWPKKINCIVVWLCFKRNRSLFSSQCITFVCNGTILPLPVKKCDFKIFLVGKKMSPKSQKRKIHLQVKSPVRICVTVIVPIRMEVLLLGELLHM